MWAEAIVTPPTISAVDYADIRAHLRLPDDTEAALVTSMIEAAVAKVETDTGRKLMAQTWDYSTDAFPEDGVLVLPWMPLSSVTSITTTSLAGVSSVVSSSVYQVDTVSIPPRIGLADDQSWPSDLRAINGVVVRAVVGCATAAAVPEPLKLAVKMLVAQWYAARTASGAPLPPPWMGYDAVIAPYRTSFGAA